ncbi:hypothetical protein CDD81_7045 [Ophiocordyceps australis]|uniref:Helicase ATP-binding domain-containing protein n=1 Tax=Ophiocordyceps australis TaxID=1399860 RepID=A0A2C5YGF3_9HYPO|nr:hypothetical protein CDD81_7045 [Ophiocordyceps australis]
MKPNDKKRRPGAGFEFNPQNTLSSPRKPSFQKRRTIFTADVACWDAETDIMVNERAPPKTPKAPTPPRAQDDKLQPARSREANDDVTAMLRGWDDIASKQGDGFSSSGRPTDGPTFGHPTKMVSSLNKKANIFIQQKTRPEHHLGSNGVSSSRPAPRHEWRPPPMPMFNSNVPTNAPVRPGDEVFYTDPAKAQADLKALLEGGLDEDDQDEEGIGQEQPSTQKQIDDASEPRQKSKTRIGQDGIVDDLEVKLLPHQVEGVNWMRGRELGPVRRGRVPKGGLLADDMGLGKTLQTVSLMLLNQRPEKGDAGWKKSFENVEKTTLVVAPLALIKQWEHEIHGKVSRRKALKVLVHHGPQRTKNYKDLARYDVVITTYQILVSEHARSSKTQEGPMAGCFGLRWWRVVLDEAHTIKNRNAKSTQACYALKSEYRWCLSGTPMQNNLDELQSLIRFLRIGPYDDLKHWKEHIDAPMKNGKGNLAIKRLHSVLRCFMKRRLKEILKKEGALNPGGKPSAEGDKSATEFRHTERKIVMVTATLNEAERRFYDRLEKRADQRIEAMKREKLTYAGAFTLLLRLRQACNHVKLVEGKVDSMGDTPAQSNPQSQDIDSLADQLSAMDIKVKGCTACGEPLSRNDVDLARNYCSECHSNLELFDKEMKLDEAKSSKAKAKGSKQGRKAQGDEPVPASKKQAGRRPRNYRAVIDSDDEDKGSWLVPEDKRGSLTLGQCGGEEDENAEGGGDWIGSEDSASETAGNDNDKSSLSSFIVDDETACGEEWQATDLVPGQEDDSLLSISAITKQMARQTLREAPDGPETTRAQRKHGDGQEPDSDSKGEYSRPVKGAKARLMASSKIGEVTRLLEAEADKHKFIVFSQFTSMLDLMEPFVEKTGLGYSRYDGGMRNDAREESLRRLREDNKVRVLLCSLMCGSLGLNLTAATRVIIVEPFWNPFIEEQAIDRVHRLNQTVDVTVYKLTVADTVEQRILNLQERKRLLAEQTIEGGARKAAVNLGLAEMMNLFKPGGHGEGEGEGAARAAAHHTGPARQESVIYGRRW